MNLPSRRIRREKQTHDSIATLRGINVCNVLRTAQANFLTVIKFGRFGHFLGRQVIQIISVPDPTFLASWPLKLHLVSRLLSGQFRSNFRMCSLQVNLQFQKKQFDTNIIAPEKCYPGWSEPIPRSSWLNTGGAAQSPPTTPLALIAVSNTTCQHMGWESWDG